MSGPLVAAPLFAISDGAHGGGNPNFFFLPPLQRSPRNSPNFDRGRFNPSLHPTVKICDGRNLTTQGECAKPLLKNGQPVVFQAVRGWDGLPDWIDPEQYHVLWQTRNYGLKTGNPYRILVKVGSTLLGYLDIVPTGTLLGALRISAGGQDVGWLQSTIVPIRFRIEKGALCTEGVNPDCTESTVIGAAPGTPGDTTKAIILPSGHAALEIPPGAVKPGDTVTIVIEKQAPPDTVNGTPQCLPTGLLQSKGCYHASSTPDLYRFATPVTMEVCVDVAGFSDADTARMQLFKFNQTQGLQALPRVDPTHIDCDNFTAMANPAGARPSNLAAAALHRLGQWAERILAPPPLMASMLGGVPKGIGGGGGSLSDFGGAVPAAVAILSATPAESTLVIDGDSVPVVTRLMNYTSDTLRGVTIRAWIEQPGASRYAFSQDTLLWCGQTPGELLPGLCTDPYRGLFASNTNAGSGTLVAGSATVRIELAQGGAALATYSFPVMLSAVDITHASLDSYALVIGGDSVGSVAGLVNHGDSTLFGVEFHAWIEQPGASREAHAWVGLACSDTPGALPPGTCTDRRGVFASNTSAGSGTLVPGSATIRFTLTQGSTVLATYLTPVQLLNTAIDSVHLFRDTLTIGGAEVRDTVLLVNTGTTLSGVQLKARIIQNSASRQADSVDVPCGPSPGVLQSGWCAFGGYVTASNSAPGSGTLGAGAAWVYFELVQGTTVLGTYTVPVTLVNP